MATAVEETAKCKGSSITSPFIHPSTGDIHYVSTGTGEIYAIDGGAQKCVLNSGGMPTAAQFDADGTLYVTDLAHGAVMRLDENDNLSPVVKVYEDTPFKGPSSLIFDRNRRLFFTDSGPLGETTLEKPKGSVFCIESHPDGSQVLRPLALEALAHPSALCVAPDRDVIYVAETMQNRLLRLFQKPTGIYHCSVFYNFSGGIGPSCIACDSFGRIFVGSYEIGLETGTIHVLSPSGELIRRLQVPGSEVTGLVIKDQTRLYVTEASTNSLHCIDLEKVL